MRCFSLTTRKKRKKRKGQELECAILLVLVETPFIGEGVFKLIIKGAKNEENALSFNGIIDVGYNCLR